MRKLGIPPENLQPDRYHGPRANVTPCVEAKRRPLTSDTQYPLLTLWRVDRDPSTGSEGEVWQLVRFETSPAGDATWRRIDYSNAGPGIDSVTVDAITAPGVNPVEADGSGDIDILGGVVANHTVPLESRSRALNALNLEIQVATERTGAPANMLDAGVCSFDDTAFVVDANGYVTLAGGAGPAIDSIDVDFNTAPGTDPVVPGGTGQVSIFGNTVTNATNANAPVATHSRAANQLHVDVQLSTAVAGAPADPFDAGLCSFESTQFAVDANGHVTLAGGGLAVDQINVQSTAGGGTDPVVPAATGEITVNGAAVAAASTPVQSISRAANAYNIEVQYAAAAASTTATDSGIAHFSSADFTVDANGFVELVGAPVTSGGTHNLGLDLTAGVLTLQGATAALSATNPGYVSIPSVVDPGEIITHKLTSNFDVNDATSGGGSDMTNNLFGIFTGGVWTASPYPLYLYMAADNADANPLPFLSRVPHLTQLPAEANIGAPDDAVCDTQGSVFCFDNLTEANYAGSPCVLIGALRATRDGSDDTTFTTLNASDGIGRFHEETTFDFPVALQGAASGTHLTANGGTAPVFSTTTYRYKVTRAGILFCEPQLEGDGGTDGAGAVNVEVTMPLQIDDVNAGSCLVIFPAASSMHQVRSLTATKELFNVFRYDNTVATNAAFGNGNRAINGLFHGRIEILGTSS